MRETIEKRNFTETEFQKLLEICAADPQGPRTLNGVLWFYVRIARRLRKQLDEQLDPASHDD
jgi:hypothetical protein